MNLGLISLYLSRASADPPQALRPQQSDHACVSHNVQIDWRLRLLCCGCVCTLLRGRALGLFWGACASLRSITAGAFSPDSLEVAVGTSNGKCLLFDLRYCRPLVQFEHRNFAAVNTLQWLKPPSAAASAAAAAEDTAAAAAAEIAAAATAGTGSPGGAAALSASGFRRVASCDGVSIKVWSANAASCTSGNNARLLASIEAPLVWENPVAPRNDKEEQQQQQRQKEQQQQRVVRFSAFTFYGDSGLVLASTDHRQMAAYFVPSIGLAPKSELRDLHLASACALL